MNLRPSHGPRPHPALFALLLSLSAAAPLPAAFSDLDGVWQFDLGFNESTLGTALTPVGFIPAYDTTTINGKTATFLDLPPLPATHWLEMPNGVGPNGIGAPTRTNEWTIMMDIKLTSFASDAALLQTDPTNTSDAEIHIDGGRAPDGGEGVFYEYYEFPGAISVLPDFDTLTPLRDGRSDTFDLAAATPRADQFGYRFTGRLQIHTSGSYTFYTTSDDGSKLLIDGQLVVNNDGLHSAQEASGSITLTKGVHPIEVQFFENTGDAVLLAEYEGPGVTRQEIPLDVLSYGNAGTLRFGADPMTDPGAIQIDTWHRLAITCELSNFQLLCKAYLDGVRTNIGSSFPELIKPFDGDYSLAATVNLFADNDDETGSFQVNSLSYWGEALTPEEVAALATTKPNGCPDAYVENTLNTGFGSLRNHIADIPAGGSIYFDFALAGQSLLLGSGAALDLVADIEIVAEYLPSNFVLDGTDQYTIFEIDAGVEAFLSGLTITNGRTIVGGGGISNEGDLTVTRCAITNCTAAFGGGLINESSGTIYITDTIFSGNVSSGGGGVTNAGVALLERCSIFDNEAGSSGGLENVGVATLLNCTLSDNRATDGGGGGAATLGDLILINTTVSGNSSVDEDPFFQEGGGGIYLDFTAALTIENSIVAGNTSSLPAEDNIGGFGSMNTFGVNLTSGDPNLATLGMYGGLTPTMPPVAGSPAAGEGIPTGNTPLTDQRGYPRINGALDIGAAETDFTSAPPPAPSLYAAWAAANIPGGQDASFTGDADLDGVDNGMEYALRLDPQVHDHDLVPLAGRVPGAGGEPYDLELTFPFNDSAPDLVYLLMESTDLALWNEIYRYTVETEEETVTGGGLSTAVDNVNQEITVTDLDLAPGRLFWRMEVLEVVPAP